MSTHHPSETEEHAPPTVADAANHCAEGVQVQARGRRDAEPGLHALPGLLLGAALRRT